MEQPASPALPAILSPEGSGFYNLVRRVLRIWCGLNLGRIRVLHAETALVSGPAVLVVNHPTSFLDALILIAAFQRRVTCFLDRPFLRSPLRMLAARTLDMTAFEFRDEAWPAILQFSQETLNRGRLILVFATQASRHSEVESAFAPAGAEIAAKAGVPAHPVHLFFPVPPSRMSELLIHVDGPLYAGETVPGNGEESSHRIRAFDAAIRHACRQNPFRLQPEDVDHFLVGVEGVMREDFAERWSKRPNSKQKLEDFELSPFLVKVVRELNRSHPGRLAALSEALESYREARRRAALAVLRAKTAGPWFRSWWQRLAVWCESVAGFPVACYGLLNLLIVWLLLRLFGLLRRGLWNATSREWTMRTLVALACYAGQIALAAHFLPRSEAGYYAPSLPISGAYLLRYLWLLDHRTRVVALGLEKQPRSQHLRRMRHRLIAELKRDEDRYAALSKIAH
jgi:hypothetical protein